MEAVGTHARQLVISFERWSSDRTDGQTREPSETAGSKKEARVTVNLAMVIVLNRKITHDLDVQNERSRRQRERNVGCITAKVMAYVR